MPKRRQLRGFDLKQIEGVAELIGVDEAGRGALAGPVVADLPHVCSAVETGPPITTVFAEGGSIDSVRDQLRDRAAVVRDIFARSTPRDTV